MVPLSVLALQIGMVEQQVAALTEQLRLHHACNRGSDAVILDTARLQLSRAAEWVRMASETVRRLQPATLAASFAAPVLTPTEVLRQVEARA